jgi:hypothetical protein
LTGCARPYCGAFAGALLFHLVFWQNSFVHGMIPLFLGVQYSGIAGRFCSFFLSEPAGCFLLVFHFPVLIFQKQPCFAVQTIVGGLVFFCLSFYAREFLKILFVFTVSVFSAAL